MRSWLDGVVRDALPLQYDSNTYVGAYVYSCVEDGGCYVLECDVYLEEGGDSLPEFAADNALTWLCDATVCVKRNGNEYELVSVEAGVNRPEGIWMALPTTICTATSRIAARSGSRPKIAFMSPVPRHHGLSGSGSVTTPGAPIDTAESRSG